MEAVPTAVPGTGSSAVAGDRSGALVDPEASELVIVIAASTLVRDDVSANTKVHAGAPRPITASYAARVATPAHAVPVVPAPIVAAEPEDPEALEDIVELELAEPTDFSVPPPETAAAAETTDAAAQPPMPSPSLEVVEPRPRKTELGVAVGPSDLAIEPDETTDQSQLTTDETTGDATVEAGGAANPAAPPVSTSVEEETPLEIWRLPAGAILPVHAARFAASASADATAPNAASVDDAPVPSSPEAGDPVAAAMPGAVLPSGDWTIALDPGAPDGWSAPFPTVSGAEATGDPTGSGRTRPQAVNALRPRPPAPRTELPAVEPKVQIDPTLIEPLRPMPTEPGLAADPSMPHGAAQPGGYPPPYGLPSMHGHEAPAYAMDPAYQMIPVAGLASPGGSYVDARPGSETALRVPASRRRATIVLLSAAVAVAIGIVVVAVLSGPRDPDAKRNPSHGHGHGHGHGAPPPATAPARTPPASPEQPAPGAEHAAAPGDPSALTGAVAGASGNGPCFASVSSTPTGAEIVIDQTKVIGTTPQTVSLPCGAEVELVVRKARLLPVTRTVTPTPTGVKVRVALTKQAVLLKVSSNPEGATITLNGKALGVTPTTVKVPALESSTLMIAKPGYETEAEKVGPKSNNATLRVQLRRLERVR